MPEYIGTTSITPGVHRKRKEASKTPGVDMKNTEKTIHMKWKKIFRNKHATYWWRTNITYSNSMIGQNEMDQYNIHHSRLVPVSRPARFAFSLSHLRTSSSTFFDHSIYCWSRRVIHVSIHSWKWHQWVFVLSTSLFHKQEMKQIN